MKILQSELIGKLHKAPAGKIVIATNKGSLQYYLRKDSSDKHGKYIRKGNQRTISLYLQKNYDEKLLKLISKEISNLETFLSNSNECVARIQELYSKYPKEIKMNITAYDMSDEDYAEEWAGSEFVPKAMMKNQISFLTKNGEYVRSKSELTIANALYDSGVIYRYEAPLKLADGRIIHPDFTVLNSRERKVKYWEHRGMMDDRDYARNSVKRIRDLQKNGIYLGDNLIITEETMVHPLGTDEIADVISRYFI